LLTDKISTTFAAPNVTLRPSYEKGKNAPAMTTSAPPFTLPVLAVTEVIVGVCMIGDAPLELTKPLKLI
jgi:hypothetical protein